MRSLQWLEEALVLRDPASGLPLPPAAPALSGWSFTELGVDGVSGPRVAEVLARYGLAGHADHPAHLLSGGQKQLLAIAGVLVMRPARVVFDEPTTLLDLINARRIARVIDELEQQVLVVTHQLELLDSFDRVLVIDEGRVVEDAAPHPAIAAYRSLMERR